ncbi:hypothetical protein L6164_032166 [Bauhinia variegata]|uniref:Uncharacterized protein n=1 Tax=Bauhinia variegata TaxID=167791 RepID=A0ACB9KMP8_BAUVA|nr:hypothetical protein L6164_032166 [Bauhinia variegata]
MVNAANISEQSHFNQLLGETVVNEVANAIANLPNGKRGGRVLSASCNIRYEVSRFYNRESPPVPPTKGKSTSTVTILAIAIPIVLSLLLILSRRPKKKYETMPEGSVEISNQNFLQLDLDTIKIASNNFCEDNILGDGGFREVYKAWKNWREGTPLELLDASLEAWYSRVEVIRCIHIGLLCVQEDPDQRPTVHFRIAAMENYIAIVVPIRLSVFHFLPGCRFIASPCSKTSCYESGYVVDLSKLCSKKLLSNATIPHA